MADYFYSLTTILEAAQVDCLPWLGLAPIVEEIAMEENQ